VRHIRGFVLALGFLAWSGCSIPAQRNKASGLGNATEVGKSPGDITDRARAALEMQDIRYDGQTLSGRILVGAVGGALRLDRRLISSASVNVDAVSDCMTGSPVTFLLVDGFPPAPRDEDLLILKPGYWYGARVLFPLFSERFMGKAGPECIEADVSLLSYGGEPVGNTHIRAVRPHPSPVDAGALEDVGASPDAGAPAEP
jgi:hypothetical protein